MTLTEALAIYVLIREQSMGAHDEAQRRTYNKAMELIYDNAVAIIEREWEKRG